MHQRNAARVLPVPVGARINVESPREIAGQPSSWGLVAPGKTALNQSRTAGWKSSMLLPCETGTVADGSTAGADFRDLFIGGKATTGRVRLDAFGHRFAAGAQLR